MLILTIVMTSSGAQAGGAASSTSRAVLERQTQNLVRTYNRGDHRSIARFYAPDASIIELNSLGLFRVVATGRTNIANYYDASTAARWTIDTTDVKITGDQAVQLARLRTSDTKGELTFMFIWQRNAAGTWLIVSDIYKR